LYVSLHQRWKVVATITGRKLGLTTKKLCESNGRWGMSFPDA
jgi:hypothetical protein